MAIQEIAILRKSIPQALLFHAVASFFLVLVVWEGADKFNFLIWLIYLASTSLIALWHAVNSTIAWQSNLRLKYISALFAAEILLWASAWPLAYWLLMPADLTDQIAVLTIALALSAGSSHVLGMHFVSAACFILCILFPLAIRLIADPYQDTTPIGIAVLAFLPTYLYVCYRSGSSISEARHVQYQREKAIEQLKHEAEREYAFRNRTEQALKLAERACLEKSRFLAAASHDLRQPIHAISLFVAALKSETMETRCKYLVDRLDRSLAGLDCLFNRLLDISRLDAGVITPAMRNFDAHSLAQTLESRFLSVAQHKSLELRVRCPEALIIHSDPELLTEILMNFLSNAIRYTERGTILLAFRRKGNNVAIQVWDTGCGIPSDSLDLIFNEFVQLDNPARDRRKGLGLGLAIVKRLCTLLGHGLRVTSKPGRGSMFEISVARALCADLQQPDITETHHAKQELAGTLVLVVDDEVDILAAMEAILSSWGCFTILARSVEEAAKYVESSLRYPDILITDHRLEGHKTSFDVVNALKPVLPYEIPVVVISGETNPTLEKEVLASGWSFMNKPVNELHLHEAISQACERAQSCMQKAA